MEPQQNFNNQNSPQVIMPGQPAGQFISQQPGAAPMQGQPAVGQQIMMPGPMMPQGAAPEAGSTVIASSSPEAKQPATVPPSKDAPSSTQATLLISELRDNVVIMKDGSFRAVVACKSINFDLMSDTEREGIEYSYQNFLNSLKFTRQIAARRYWPIYRDAHRDSPQ